ncbi:DUF4236 domain-containing protein [Anaerococcus sp. AGMB09787]|uniref:DUF4236 domain-containing protein n=1 Tax=Anaerococcus sp. AGMB09787 TaxID=2922869 RepID=UPI001FAF028C|nr:DUF4236 domain-containing protein [Anaerococcus sp. AGMB09787]
MGIRFRKSINLGKGFRINMSKSGPGLSWGGKGFRLTRTAKGNIRTTASIPGTGFSYQKEFKNPLRAKKNKEARKETSKGDKAIDFDQVLSYGVDFDKLKSTALEDVLEATSSRRPYKLIGLIISILAIILAFKNIFFGLGLIPGFLLFFYKSKADDAYIDYDFNQDSAEEFDITNKLLLGILESDKNWFVDRLGLVGDSKSILARDELRLNKGVKGGFKTNAEVISLDGRDLALSFLPDCLLIVRGYEKRALAYEDIEVDLGAEVFLEDEVIPKDAKLIEKTYLHTNKDGSRDQRYKTNPEVNRVEYGTLELRGDGIDLLIAFSDTYIDGK